MDSYPIGTFYDKNAPWWDKDDKEIDEEKEYDPDEDE